MKIQNIDEDYFPEEDQQFDFISNPDGKCHSWLCSKPGVVLVYDDMVPEFGYWFCEECWQDFADIPWLVVVQDTRERQGEP